MKSTTKFYHEIQIILQMRSYDQRFVTVAFLWEKLSQPQFDRNLTRKTVFFEGWFWFKFNKLGLTQGTNLKFYTSVIKGSKLKVRKFPGLIRTFVEVTGEKLVEVAFLPSQPPPPRPSPPTILNRVKLLSIQYIKSSINLCFIIKKLIQVK